MPCFMWELPHCWDQRHMQKSLFCSCWHNHWFCDPRRCGQPGHASHIVLAGSTDKLQAWNTLNEKLQWKVLWWASNNKLQLFVSTNMRKWENTTNDDKQEWSEVKQFKQNEHQEQKKKCVASSLWDIKRHIWKRNNRNWKWRKTVETASKLTQKNCFFLDHPDSRFYESWKNWC